MANYTKSSPYAFTPMNKAGYLDILNIRSITAEDDDILYQIETIADEISEWMVIRTLPY